MKYWEYSGILQKAAASSKFGQVLPLIWTLQGTFFQNGCMVSQTAALHASRLCNTTCRVSSGKASAGTT